MRLLAIDYGERRIGLAISDELGLTARPLTTIQRLPKPRAFTEILRLITENEVTQVIVGLPLRLDGSRGDAAARVEKFIDELARQMHRELGEAGACPIVSWDERLTSVAAQERMREMGLNEKARRERIDEFAALVILEDYLANQ